jgi:hypothetical protein
MFVCSILPPVFCQIGHEKGPPASTSGPQLRLSTLILALFAPLSIPRRSLNRTGVCSRRGTLAFPRATAERPILAGECHLYEKRLLIGSVATPQPSGHAGESGWPLLSAVGGLGRTRPKKGESCLYRLLGAGGAREMLVSSRESGE